MVIQAKFRVGDPETFLRLQIVDELAGFWLSTCQTEQVSDTYLDTRERRLQEAGYCFRRREQPDGLRMTLATLSKPAGAVHRWEKWEYFVESDRLLAKWPDSSIRTKMLQLIGNKRLEPLVHLQQTRIIRCLGRGEQQIAEVRADSVSYKIGARQHLHFEVEVELIPSARVETLMEIVDYLEDEWQLWPEHLTKFERAFAPVTGLPVNRINEALI